MCQKTLDVLSLRKKKMVRINNQWWVVTPMGNRVKCSGFQEAKEVHIKFYGRE